MKDDICNKGNSKALTKDLLKKGWNAHDIKYQYPVYYRLTDEGKKP